MGEDPRAGDADSVGGTGLRAGGTPARPAAGSPGAAREWRGFDALTLTEAQLEHWGRRVGAEVSAPAFFALRGELGAGKSVLARAIARGAGVRSMMPSPNFKLVFRYEAKMGIYVLHHDLYRLDRPGDQWATGWSGNGAD